MALGWLGWSEAQTLASDMNAIVIGYRGRCDMLRQVFGGKEEDKPVPFTPAAFRSVFSK